MEKHLSLKNTLVASLLFLFTVACTKNVSEPDTPANTVAETNTLLTLNESTNPAYCKTEETCLWAGQTIDAGSVVVSNDAQNLYITVNSTEGFQNVAENVKLWVGTDLSNLPTNPQNVPVPGQFPLKYTANGTSITITIPFNTISSDAPVTCNSTGLFIFVHVDAIANGGSETAWGGCTAGTNTNRWYFYHTYTTGCCTEPPPPGNCFSQTAFAKGGYVFTTDKKSNPENLPSLALTKNRWGWAINLKTPGVTEYNIWAGAGLNNTSKGKLVGKLTVNWNGTAATVTYSMNTGFKVSETHVYISDYKPWTLAPGQYGNTTGFMPPASSYTASYNVTDTNSDGIWIIAHAGVSGCY